MTIRPADRDEEIDDILGMLNVEAVAFTECRIERGWSLGLGPAPLPGLHYVLEGEGVLAIKGGPRIALTPRTLILTPPGIHYRMEMPTGDGRPLRLHEPTVLPCNPRGQFYSTVAGDGRGDLVIICGHFRARHPASEDLFASLDAPIIERFDASDCPASLLGLVSIELAEHRMGMRTMASALLKQVLVKLFRRTLVASPGWSQRLALLGDPQVSRAFTAMIARPGDPHSLKSLSNTACLSRSSFVRRFTNAFGQPPGVVLREIRLERAAELLLTRRFLVAQVAEFAGYASYSSFSRAFRRHFGCDPSHYCEARERVGKTPSARLGAMIGLSAP
ncbi:MAG: AraC family transcriptional regulator [Sphingomonas sp.]|uniref:AraC family transcriptional regulator n=1 Tax=Sphingomonas sp. TaxID=28214 RepID=UPI0025E6A20F|nr:AraC family transcriptional regulator [Sphingomonas sp.]MBX9883317.1 AraC family transcriptional regulator [Sphingomonas sp.]